MPSLLTGGGKHAKLHVRKCQYGIICFSDYFLVMQVGTAAGGKVAFVARS